MRFSALASPQHEYDLQGALAWYLHPSRARGVPMVWDCSPNHERHTSSSLR